jgi:hypothetical protein
VLSIALLGVVIVTLLTFVYPAWRSAQAEEKLKKDKKDLWLERARERRRRRRPPISQEAFNNPDDSGEEEDWYKRELEHERLERTDAYKEAREAFIHWRHRERQQGRTGPFRTTPLCFMELMSEEKIGLLARISRQDHKDCDCGWDVESGLNLKEATYWNL